MAPSTLAGIITASSAVALLITAVAGLISSLAAFSKTRQELNTKIDAVHVIVNQQRTDMQRYIRALTGKLQSEGIDIPIDQSLETKDEDNGNQEQPG